PAHTPRSDQAFLDIGVVLGKALGHGAVPRREDKGGAIDRVGEGPRHQEFTALVRVSYELEVGVAEGRAARDEVFHHVVEQQVIHTSPLSLLVAMGQRDASSAGCAAAEVHTTTCTSGRAGGGV